MDFRFFCILFLFCGEIFASESNSKSSCQKTFKSQSVYETGKFLDKKYSLNYLKNVVDKIFSVKQIMHAYPVLEREEMMGIAKHYQEHQDERSYYILFFSNLKLAYSFALSYSKYDRENFEDYLQEALLALSKAIKGYDSLDGTASFSTYAGKSILNAFGRFQNYNPELGIKVYRDRELVKKLGEELLKNPEEYGTADWLEKFQKTYRSYGSLFSKERIQAAMLNIPAQGSGQGVASLRLNGVRASANNEIPSDFDKLQASVNLEKRSVDRVFLQNILEWLGEKLKDASNREMLFAIIEERIFVEEKDKTSLKKLAERFGRSSERVRQKENEIRGIIRAQFGAQKDYHPLNDKEVSLENILEWLDRELKDAPDKNLLFAIIEERIFFGERDRTLLKRFAERFGRSFETIRKKEGKIRGMIRAQFGEKIYNDFASFSKIKKRDIELEEILERVLLKDILEWLDRELKDAPRREMLFAIIEERIFAEKDKTSLKKLAERFGISFETIRKREYEIRIMIKNRFGTKKNPEKPISFKKKLSKKEIELEKILEKVPLKDVLEWLREELKDKPDKDLLYAIIEERIFAPREDRATFREIGEKFGKSYERVRQKEDEIRGMIRSQFGEDIHPLSDKEVSLKDILEWLREELKEEPDKDLLYAIIEERIFTPREDKAAFREIGEKFEKPLESVRQREKRIEKMIKDRLGEKIYNDFVLSKYKKKEFELKGIIEKIPSKDILEWLDKKIKRNEKRDLLFAIVEERIFASKEDKVTLQKLAERFNSNPSSIYREENRIRKMIRKRFGAKDKSGDSVSKFKMEDIELEGVFLKDILEWLREELKDAPEKDLLFAIIEERIFTPKEDRARLRELGKRFNKGYETVRQKEIAVKKMIRDQFGDNEVKG